VRPLLFGALLGTLSLAASACGRPAREAAASNAPASSPSKSRFQPPPDGLLTGPHLDLYLKVRRAAKGRPDADAARAVGIHPDEFAWVRARVVEASIALDARRVARAAGETYARSLAAVREARQRAKEPETVRAVEREIALLERERASLLRAEPLPPAVAANARLVAGRRTEIEAVSR
jgi:hypothetical protein